MGSSESTLQYYHVSSKPITKFDDMIYEHKSSFLNLKEPIGLYYTNYTGAYTVEYMIHKCDTECHLYSFNIPDKYITTELIPDRNCVFKLTEKNWKKFSDYIKTHSLKQLYDDFAGVDANDQDFLFDYFNYRFSYDGQRKIIKYLKTHKDDNLANVFFPKMFSGLRFLNIAPEGVIWRGSEWLSLNEVKLTDETMNTLVKGSIMSNIISTFNDIKQFKSDEKKMVAMMFADPFMAIGGVYNTIDLLESVDYDNIILFKPISNIEKRKYKLFDILFYIIKNRKDRKDRKDTHDTHDKLSLDDIRSGFLSSTYGKKYSDIEINLIIEALYMYTYIKSGAIGTPIPNEIDELKYYITCNHRTIPLIVKKDDKYYYYPNKLYPSI